jgi:hypothetical protein
MNKKRLCEIVEKYKGRFVRGMLTPTYDDMYCIIGACLTEAGVPKDQLEIQDGDSDSVWANFSDELQTQGIESVDEVHDLIDVNDTKVYSTDVDPHAEDARPIPIEDRLRQFLACEGDE